TVLENDLLKLTLSNRGGKISSAELKGVKTSDGKPLLLFMPDSTYFGLILNAYSGYLATDTLYFSPTNITTASNGDSSSVTMRLNTSDPSKHLDYIYSVKKGSYMVGCSIRVTGM